MWVVVFKDGAAGRRIVWRVGKSPLDEEPKEDHLGWDERVLIPRIRRLARSVLVPFFGRDPSDEERRWHRGGVLVENGRRWKIGWMDFDFGLIRKVAGGSFLLIL